MVLCSESASRSKASGITKPGPTQASPPHLPQAFQIDLILCVLEKILLSSLTPDQRGLECRPALCDLVNLVLQPKSAYRHVGLTPPCYLTFENSPFSYKSLSSGRVASSWNWTFSMAESVDDVGRVRGCLVETVNSNLVANFLPETMTCRSYSRA